MRARKRRTGVGKTCWTAERNANRIRAIPTEGSAAIGVPTPVTASTKHKVSEIDPFLTASGRDGARAKTTCARQEP